MRNVFDISHLQRAISRSIDESVSQIRIQAENFYLDTFKREGFTDQTFSPWPPRKADRQGRLPRGQRRGLLIKSGDLRRSIEVKKEPGSAVRIYIDENISGKSGKVVNYAEVHNTGKGKMPKRQFIGESATLNRNIISAIERIFRKNLS